MKKKTFWMLHNLNKGCYLCCYKHRCHKSQFFMQIFITVKESFFWKGIQQWIQQIDYCNKTFKETNQRQSVFGSSHWELDRYSELFFLFRISEKYLWKRSFLTMLQAVDLQFYLKKESLSRHFSRILPIDSVGKIKEQLV